MRFADETERVETPGPTIEDAELSATSPADPTSPAEAEELAAAAAAEGEEPAAAAAAAGQQPAAAAAIPTEHLNYADSRYVVELTAEGERELQEVMDQFARKGPAAAAAVAKLTGAGLPPRLPAAAAAAAPKAAAPKPATAVPPGGAGPPASPKAAPKMKAAPAHVIAAAAARAPPPPPPTALQLAQADGRVGLAPPRGHPLPYYGWAATQLSAHPAPGGLDLNCVSKAPAFLAATAVDFRTGVGRLAAVLANGQQNGAAITIVTRGSRINPGERHWRGLPPRRQANRTFDCTFANDPAQQARDRGPESACCGQNGRIQLHVSRYVEFENLLRDVRGKLILDLLWPFIGEAGNDHSQVRQVTYAMQCHKGRHRSVAVAELLAHVLYTAGIGSVEVIHEDLPLNRGPCGCPDPQACLNRPPPDRAADWQTDLQNARQYARNAWRDWRL